MWQQHSVTLVCFGFAVIMTAEETLFQMSLEGEMQDVYYFQQISHEQDDLIFKLPCGGAIIRNSSDNGAIPKFRTVKEYEHSRKETNKNLWLLMPLKIFRSNNGLFGVYCCPECESMFGTNALAINQDPVQILSRLCVHSKVCSTILGDWREIWDINISPEDQLVRIVCNADIAFYTFQKRTKKQTLLAAVRSKDEVSLLYTATCRQESPICSSCVTRKCLHVISYDNYTETGENQDVATPGLDEVTNDVSHNLDQNHLDRAENTSESGSDGDGDGDGDGDTGKAEKGKHKNYWVSTNKCKFMSCY